MILKLVLIAAFFCVASCVPEPDSVADHAGRVVRVVDGDSLYLQGLDPQIRLFGVDAPERDETGFQGAKVRLSELAMDKDLSCKEVERDRYERIVARCFLTDGREINLLMLDTPHVLEYCRFSKGYYGRC